MRTAVIAAIVAALISATSATAAFVVTSKNIKNGTIQPIDLSAKTKRTLQGHTGERGPAGFQTVSQVVAGALLPASSGVTVAASCPVGTKVTGGGFDSGTASVAIVRSEPNVASGEWRVNARNLVATAGFVRVYAVCAG